LDISGFSDDLAHHPRTALKDTCCYDTGCGCGRRCRSHKGQLEIMEPALESLSRLFEQDIGVSGESTEAASTGPGDNASWSDGGAVPTLPEVGIDSDEGALPKPPEDALDEDVEGDLGDNEDGKRSGHVQETLEGPLDLSNFPGRNSVPMGPHVRSQSEGKCSGDGESLSVLTPASRSTSLSPAAPESGDSNYLWSLTHLNDIGLAAQERRGSTPAYSAQTSVETLQEEVDDDIGYDEDYSNPTGVLDTESPSERCRFTSERPPHSVPGELVDLVRELRQTVAKEWDRIYGHDEPNPFRAYHDDPAGYTTFPVWLVAGPGSTDE
ncbi:hypothetical protein BU23DRAFT_650479, partial [Bimuria novae-zelandiae CBS 107.79]